MHGNYVPITGCQRQCCMVTTFPTLAVGSAVQQCCMVTSFPTLVVAESVRPDGAAKSVRPEGAAESVRPDGAAESVRPQEGSTGTAVLHGNYVPNTGCSQQRCMVTSFPTLAAGSAVQR